MRRLLLIVTLAATVPACAAVASYLPTVIAAIQDASLVIQTIETFVDAFFARRPDPDLQAKVDAAITKTRTALHVALRATSGVENLTQEQVDAAFAEFKAAYQELISLVSPLGVATGDSLRATPMGITVPEPLALTLKVK